MRKAVKNNVTLPMGSQVKSEAVQTIIERMGITKAAVFLRDTMSQPTDYLTLKENMCAKTSAAEVYASIKAQ
ncbi:MAG: hypothetical protein WCK54_09985 [Desulfuromonadales bacterium]